MSERDYYEVLGVNKGADEAKIKKAYKRLAMKYHPDRNAGDKAGAEKKFKEVRKAYDVISDQQKRAAYDQFGHAGVGQNGQGFGGGTHLVELEALEIYLVIFLVVAIQNPTIEVQIFVMI